MFFTPRFQAGYLIFTLLLFCGVARLTGAGWRHVAGALASVLVFTAIAPSLDDFAVRHGWWRFPSCGNLPHPPLAIYLGQSLEFVGCLAFIGWRIQRRFGARGIAWLLGIVCVLGPARDFGAAAVLPEVIRFGPQPASWLADTAAWAVVVLVALGVSRVVSGRGAGP